jgi:hypothetical protein
VAVEVRPLEGFQSVPEGLIDGNGDLWQSPSGLGKRLGTAGQNVYNWIKTGKLPAIAVKLHDRPYYYARYVDAVRCSVLVWERPKGRKRKPKRWRSNLYKGHPYKP